MDTTNNIDVFLKEFQPATKSEFETVKSASEIIAQSEMQISEAELTKLLIEKGFEQIASEGKLFFLLKEV